MKTTKKMLLKSLHSKGDEMSVLDRADVIEKISHCNKVLFDLVTEASISKQEVELNKDSNYNKPKE